MTNIVLFYNNFITCRTKRKLWGNKEICSVYLLGDPSKLFHYGKNQCLETKLVQLCCLMCPSNIHLHSFMTSSIISCGFILCIMCWDLIWGLPSVCLGFGLLFSMSCGTLANKTQRLWIGVTPKWQLSTEHHLPKVLLRKTSIILC